MEKKKVDSPKPKYYYHHGRFNCAHVGCRRVITHFMSTDPDPNAGPVWCRDHAREAVRRGPDPSFKL